MLFLWNLGENIKLFFNVTMCSEILFKHKESAENNKIKFLNDTYILSHVENVVLSQCLGSNGEAQSKMEA